ncbi:MAG: cysteine desulfuration protein SufE, partial [Actinomycetota bacterium]|nr:cysteine desulfuration protein SufE [Actinomycetota bacterium]
MEQNLPVRLGAIVDDFRETPERQRLELLLEFGEELPPLPARLEADPGSMEPVTECRSPLFLLAEPDAPGQLDSPVHLYFSAPAEAPTTRGFAAVLAVGLDGLPAEAVLAVPDDLPRLLGLGTAVSPLRL